MSIENPFEQSSEQPPVETEKKELTFSGEIKEAEEETLAEREARETVRSRISAEKDELEARLSAIPADRAVLTQGGLTRKIRILSDLEAALNLAGTDPVGLLRQQEEKLKNPEDVIKKSKIENFDSHGRKLSDETSALLLKRRLEESNSFLKGAIEG